MTEDEFEALRRARRRAATAWFDAVNAVLSHVDADVPARCEPLIVACDEARDAFLMADLAFFAEQFQRDLVPLLGRRGDEPPKPGG